MYNPIVETYGKSPTQKLNDFKVSHATEVNHKPGSVLLWRANPMK
ncbi:uncharacterized protein METZ01_LOCUS513094, partial [marine metagenome]